MKRITTLVLFVFSVVLVMGQAPETNLLTFDQAKSRLEKSIQSSKHEKKSLKAKTWMNLAEAYIVAAEVNHQSIANGVPQMQVTLLMGKPLSTEQKEFKGSVYNVQVYDKVDVYFNEAAELAFWIEKELVVEDGLEKALKAFDKALELDVKGKLVNKVNSELIDLTTSFRKIGANYFQLGDYANAARNFEMLIKISDKPEINRVDTAMIYYTGIACLRAEKKKEALAYFNRVLEMGYTEGGSIYIEKYHILNDAGETEKAIMSLEEGFQNSPKNSAIMGLLINAYLAEGKNPEDILILLTSAKEADPENASLYVVEGNLYEKLKDTEKAVAAYDAAIERDPMNLYAYYSLGSMHINKANSYIKEANALPTSDFKAYDALIEKANGEFRESLPFLIKAQEVAPEDKDVAEILKTIYFKFRMESDEMMKGYEAMKAIVEGN